MHNSTVNRNVQSEMSSEFVRLSALLDLAEEILNEDPQQALSLATESLELAERLNDKHAAAEGLRLIGVADCSIGENYKHGLERLEQALSLYEILEDQLSIARVTGNIANIHLSIGAYGPALEKYQSALLLYEALENHAGIAGITGNIGIVYARIGDTVIALEHYRTALALHEERNDWTNFANISMNVGCLHFSIRQYEEALEAFQHVLVLRERLGEESGVAAVFHCIGKVYQDLGETSRALGDYDTSLAIYRKLENTIGIANVVISIGSIYEKIKNYKSALEQYSLGLALYEKLNSSVNAAKAAGKIGWLYMRHDFEGYDSAIAEKCIQRGIFLMEKSGDKHSLREAHRRIAEWYKRQQLWEKAYSHITKCYELHVELDESESYKRAEQIKHLKEIAELEKKQAIERAEEQAALETFSVRTQLLEAQLSRQRAELAAQAVNLAKQTEMLGIFRNDLRSIIRESANDCLTIRAIKEKLKQLPCEAIDWTKFDAEFRSTYPDFRDKILERYPDMTKMEIKIASLLKLKLVSADISKLLCISERSVEGHRLNIRKKLGLNRGDDLHMLIGSI